MGNAFSWTLNHHQICDVLLIIDFIDLVNKVNNQDGVRPILLVSVTVCNNYTTIFVLTNENYLKSNKKVWLKFCTKSCVPLRKFSISGPGCWVLKSKSQSRHSKVATNAFFLIY